MDIDTLHDKLYEMLKMFDNICKNHSVSYFLATGSAIGAVREHDFIPWDDDIDVWIYRDQYMRLREVLKTEMPEQYKLIEPIDYEPYYFDMIPKLIDERVPLRSETDEDRAYKNYQNRMAIDFVILDNVPDSVLAQKLIKFKCKLYYGMARSKRYIVDSSKMTIIEKILSTGCYILGKPFSLKKIINLYTNNTAKYQGIESNTVIISNCILYFVDFFKREWFSGAVYMDFRDMKVPVPAGYDEILTQIYGDYMTPTREYKGFTAMMHAEIE